MNNDHSQLLPEALLNNYATREKFHTSVLQEKTSSVLLKSIYKTLVSLRLFSMVYYFSFDLLYIEKSDVQQHLKLMFNVYGEKMEKV